MNIPSPYNLIAYGLGILALGLIAGFWWKQRREEKR